MVIPRSRKSARARGGAEEVRRQLTPLQAGLVEANLFQLRVYQQITISKWKKRQEKTLFEML